MSRVGNGPRVWVRGPGWWSVGTGGSVPRGPPSSLRCPPPEMGTGTESPCPERAPRAQGSWGFRFDWEEQNQCISKCGLRLAIPQNNWRDSGQTKDRTSWLPGLGGCDGEECQVSLGHPDPCVESATCFPTVGAGGGVPGEGHVLPSGLPGGQPATLSRSLPVPEQKTIAK